MKGGRDGVFATKQPFPDLVYFPGFCRFEAWKMLSMENENVETIYHFVENVRKVSSI
jgi:hypothetical protein